MSYRFVSSCVSLDAENRRAEYSLQMLIVVTVLFDFIPHGENVFELGGGMNLGRGADPEAAGNPSLVNRSAHRSSNLRLGAKRKQLGNVNPSHQNPLWIRFMDVSRIHI